jgi:putative membrane-bound dehydrogenase-like protein
MNRSIVTFLMPLLIPLAAGLASVAEGAESRFGDCTLTVPDGFEVELAAGPPLVNRPIEADFDELGRLYVTDSSGSSEKGEKQLQEKPHRVVRLEDTDGDGRFDKRTVFADRMMFPEGAMWYEGSLYVAAPPSIWKLTDADGDGVAEKREEWFQGKTLTGCANDLHGPYLGPDGWFYWAKGAFAKQTYDRPGRAPFITRAAHLFRARPDLSGIESVMTGGMDNPVEVAFTRSGERIFTTTFFQHPEAGRRDGLVHAVYGGVYGKNHDVLEGHKRTGDLMPVLVHFGPAAPCGLTRYESSAFGREFEEKDNLFATLFNLHKVTRHVLEPEGATYRLRDSDFLTSTDPDFHPTDVLEDADGSLLVLNTGGWYKVCCPTSQLQKPDVLGAIYRVRKVGAPRPRDPRGLEIPWANLDPGGLARHLADGRPAVRARAIHELGKRGGTAVASLAAALGRREPAAAAARRGAVWALARIEGEGAREAVRSALADPDETVRHSAIHAAGLWRDAGALPELLPLLAGPSTHLARAAAEAVGRIGDKQAVPALLAAAAWRSDRVLEHSLSYALVEIGDPAGTAEGLRADSAFTKRAALIAIDQMDGGALEASTIIPLLTSPDDTLRGTASWIISHRPEWGGALAGYLRSRLAAAKSGSAESEDLERELSGFARDSSVQELLASTLRDGSSSIATVHASLRAMTRAGLKVSPPAWTAGVALVLAGRNADLLRPAVATARSLVLPKEGCPELTASLQGIARDPAMAADVRLDAMAAVGERIGALEPEVFRFLLDSLDQEKPVTIRGTAAGVLAKAKLDASQLSELAERTRAVGPLEVSKVLGAFEGSAVDEALGLKLISTLRESAGLQGVRADALKPILAKAPPLVQKKGEELLAQVNVDAEKQRERLEELAVKLKGGDVRRGQTVFNSTKAACASCHTIGYLGGKVGPDLTTIGQIRTERDLLESVVFPSASFVRSYEPMVVVTRRGEVLSGVVRKDSSDEVVLAIDATTEARIPRADIADVQPGLVSVMPQGLDQQLSVEELADLVAFLKATK